MVNLLLRGDVDTVSAAALSGKIDNGEVLLLDAREPDEYAVSRIRGAVHIGYESPDFTVTDSLPRDRELVVYCSVGKRSEEIARQLETSGFTKVYNLWGGIFDWANRGYPIADAADRRVYKLHPYNAAWGFWITKCEKTYEP